MKIVQITFEDDADAELFFRLAKESLQQKGRLDRLGAGLLQDRIASSQSVSIIESDLLEVLANLRTSLMGTDLAKGYIFSADRPRIEKAMDDARAAIAKSKGTKP